VTHSYLDESRTYDPQEDMMLNNVFIVTIPMTASGMMYRYENFLLETVALSKYGTSKLSFSRISHSHPVILIYLLH
jgi:hypothetical protein